MKQKRLVLLLILLCWMVLIFWFSSQNSTESASLSSGLLKKLLSLRPDWDSLTLAQQRSKIRALHTLFRKLGHFSEYTVLGTISALLGRIGFPTDDIRQKRVRYYFVPAGFALLYAVGDEIHQRFVPGRSCEFRDMMIDFSGACLGVLLTAAAAWLLTKRRRKRRSAQPSA